MADYVYLNGRPLAKIGVAPKVPPGTTSKSLLEAGVPPDKQVIYYYHLDHLGTPLAVTDANKVVQWSTEYYPFGGLYDEMVVQSNEFRFPGQYHDRETDLYYNWHRYYDPTTGRYVSADPLGLGAGDVNLYRYVKGNSLAFGDWSGLDWWKDEDGLHWYPPDDPPIGQGLTYYADDLTDPYSKSVIDPHQAGRFIPFGDAEFSELWTKLMEHFEQCENRKNLAELRERALDNGPLGMNLKKRPAGAFSRRYDRYTSVYGIILQNQDWGNILFGAMGKRAGVSLIILKLGAGAAQIGAGNWKLKDISTFFDDPRDQAFIEAGFEIGILPRNPCGQIEVDCEKK